MDLRKYIEHPETMDRESLYDLRKYVALYPYHQVARLLMLQNLFILHDATFDEELHRAALYVTDRSTLFNMVEAQFYQLGERKKDVSQMASDDAQVLIDNFLETIPKEASKPSILDATVDYMAYMMANQETESRQVENDERSVAHDIIEEFLEKDGGKITISNTPTDEEDAPHANVTLENDRDDLQESFYTESLAKVYVKQGNYLKALEIIKQLNLNNSEKSSYFADQMRFMEKVIAAKGK